MSFDKELHDIGKKLERPHLADRKMTGRNFVYMVFFAVDGPGPDGKNFYAYKQDALKDADLPPNLANSNWSRKVRARQRSLNVDEDEYATYCACVKLEEGK
jgi:hypothetical protein